MATLEQVIGGHLRQVREAQGIRQEDVALAARAYGLDWTRGTITALELGRRHLSLGELALLPLVLSQANLTGGRVLALHELIPDTEELVEVGPMLHLPLRAVRGLLSGESGTVQQPVTVTGRAAQLAQWAAGAAEIKAGAVLGVSPAAIAEAARRTWGQSLSEERDQRVLERTQGTAVEPRRLQALRGHVTRALLAEIRPILKGHTMKKKGRA
jgi:transcriptional regulator with XRE-family HTH domain